MEVFDLSISFKLLGAFTGKKPPNKSRFEQVESALIICLHATFLAVLSHSVTFDRSVFVGYFPSFFLYSNITDLLLFN